MHSSGALQLSRALLSFPCKSAAISPPLNKALCDVLFPLILLVAIIRHIYESVQLHLPHLLCNALVASFAFQSIKKILSGKERIRLSCGSMLCRACLHYWWIPWWPRHICGSISIISISVISLLPNGVMRPRDSRSTMGSSILRRRRGLIQRTWAQYIINFPPTTFLAQWFHFITLKCK